MQRRNGPGLPPVLVPGRGPVPNTFVGDLFKLWAAYLVPLPLRLHRYSDEELSAVGYHMPIWHLFAYWCRALDLDPYRDDWSIYRMPPCGPRTPGQSGPVADDGA